LNGAAKKKAVHRVVDLCFLGSVLHQQIDTLSKGYKHRTCLAQSLIHDPDVLIMDEPTDGLDPNQKHEVRNLIREMGKTKAVIFSTHILEEVDAACTRAIIIDRGRIVANGTPEELRNMSDLAGAVTISAQGADQAKPSTRKTRPPPWPSPVPSWNWWAAKAGRSKPCAPKKDTSTRCSAESRCPTR